MSIYALTSSVLPPAIEVVGFRGTETMNRPFSLGIGFSSSDLELDTGALVGQKGTLTIDRGPDKAPIVFHGVFASAELLHAYGQMALYRVTLMPRVWLLSLSQHSRIYTDVTVPEIVKAVLEHAGLVGDDYEFRLVGGYPKREHVCQYRESDLDFIHRLLERDGLYYFFEHGEQGDKLVITDSRYQQAPFLNEPVKYVPLAMGDVTAKDAFDSFRLAHVTLPKRVLLRDYDYEKPALDVSGSANIVPSTGGEIVVFGENFTTPGEGARLAEVRAQEYLAREKVFHADGRVFAVRSGHSFVLEEHPRAGFNRAYVVVSIEHEGNSGAGGTVAKKLLGLDSDDVYKNHVVAIPDDVQFRAPRSTPWPRIDGVVGGVVDGASGGPYAEVDSHGRYKVRVFFDESDLVDGSASTWVRMLQPHGGSTEGFHFPLRKGTEVQLGFHHGDPDRPILVGVAPNAQKPSAVTVANFSSNVIQTGGANRLEMEDMTGGQFVTLSSPVMDSYLHLGAGPYGFVGHTNGNMWFYAGGNQDIDVLGDKTEDVTGAVTEKYLSTLDTTVTGAVTKTYESTLDLTVTGAVTETLEATLSTTVTGANTQTYESTLEEKVTGPVTETYSASQLTTVTGPVTEIYAATQLTTVGGMRTDIVGGAVTQIYGATTNITNGAFSQVVNGAASLTVNGPYTINASGGITILAPNWTRADANVDDTKASWFTKAAFKLSLTGIDIGLKGVSVSLAGATISISGTKLTEKGFESDNAGAKIKALGMELLTAAANINASGIVLMF
jgi:type VI secretion system secreted protein VgrG